MIALRRSATFPPETVHEIQRAADEGVYEIRGYGAKRRLPSLRRPAAAGRLGLALPARGLSRALRHRRRPRHPVREAAARAEDPDHHRRHELRRAGRQRQGGAGPGRHRHGHLDHHRRRRHDRRGAPGLQAAGLPGPALALRPQPRRPAPGRRDRGRGRPGCQARRRRHAARAEDHAARGGDARPAGGHRPAQRLPPPRLDRTGRSRDQDPGAARDHRLAEADLRQGRRHPHATTTSPWR